MTDPAADFTARLRHWLTARSLTVSELARRLGVTQQAASWWTRGRSLPDGAHMVLLPGALGLEPWEFWAQLGRSG